MSFRRWTSSSFADVGRHGDDVAGPARRADLGRGALERLGRQVGQADLHAERGEALGGGQADAARRAGDDGDAAGRQGGMAWRSSAVLIHTALTLRYSSTCCKPLSRP